MSWDGASADFKGYFGYSAGGWCWLSYAELAPCAKTQNPCLEVWEK